MTAELSFFKNRRVLITGDTGFKGSWLSFWLNRLGAKVVGYALPPKEIKDHFRLLRLDKQIHHVTGDVRDYSALEKVFKKFRPEFVFHLAAQSLVRLSYAEPKKTFDTNVAGGVNVLEAARHTPSIRSMIFVTSDKCYRNKEQIWGYRETDELGGRDPYSASKAAAELVFSSYAQSFLQSKTVGVASVRAGNVIGGGDWSVDRIIPDSIKSLAKNKPIVIRNPSATRPWQHVLDPLYGYLTLALRLYEKPAQFGGSWNFGPDEKASKTVMELTEAVLSHWGSGRVSVKQNKKSPHESTWLHLNCDKAHHNLGWYPRWAFDAAVRHTVEWYRAVVRKEATARQMTESQIDAFMESEHDS